MKRRLDPGTLVISNLAFGETSFDSDRGSWNVTRAVRDCLAGKFGPPWTFEVTELLRAAANVEIDEAKVAAMLSDKDRLLLSPPLILVEDIGKVWQIDGHHRLNAMARLGYPELAGYVIDDPEKYRVLFNGERIAPWYKRPK